MNATTTNTFDAFVSSLFDDALPPLRIVDDATDTLTYFNRTGAIPVVKEDESEPCGVFDNWKTHYEFEAWVAYRQMTGTHKLFSSMVADVLDKQPWGRDAITIISAINRLVNANS